MISTRWGRVLATPFVSPIGTSRVRPAPYFLPFKEMQLKLRPLHDRVIVKRIESETKTASGIVIPDNAAEKPDQGEVLAVGPGKKNDKGDIIALNVKVGDRVLFGKYSGQTVKVDGDEFIIMREDEILGIISRAGAAA